MRVGLVRVMLVEPTILPDVLLFTPRRFSDPRGYFMETFRSDIFNEAVGQPVHFVQENQSRSALKDTVRGLHFQAPPHEQGKLVRCLQGSILDVAVDIRVGSPTFGQSIAVELSGENDKQLWVPAGFLHGFRTLEDETVVNYKCTSIYAPDYEGAVLWNSETLDIDWGVTLPSVMSDRDQVATPFESFVSPFKFEPNS